MLALLLLGAGGSCAAPVRSQELRPLTLAEALAEARSASPEAIAARARARAADHVARAEGAYRWPTLMAEAGGVRTNDPVAVFGGRLLQGRLTRDDFDPARLVDPEALADWRAGLSAGWSPLSPVDARRHEAAVLEADAADLSAEWVTASVAFRVHVDYLRAVGAERTLAAARASLASAEADLSWVKSRESEGLLTRADLLLAAAHVEEARSRLMAADQAVADARGFLAADLGWPVGVVPAPVDTTLLDPLGPDDPRPPSAGDPALGDRPDLLASSRVVEATRARVRQAEAARWPDLSGSARIESHAPRPWEGARGAWTVGVQVTVPLFAGFSLTARRDAATAQVRAEEGAHEGRTRMAVAEIEAARRAVATSAQRAGAASAAAEAAAEAVRLQRLRFEEGLVDTARLLSTESWAADLTARAVDASVERQVSMARLAYLTRTGMNR